MTYSSTVLKYFTDYCPAALGFYKDGRAYDKGLFQGGIAAHAVLEEIGRRGIVGGKEAKAAADAVVEELITKGRAYNKVLEPPIPPESAFEGREVALKYLEYHPMMEDDTHHEIGIAMDSNGILCDYYSDEARYRAIIDRVYSLREGDEDWAGNLIVVSDWKSAWPTNASELETLQRKGQAVLAYKKYGQDKEIQGLRMEVVNIRTGRSYHKDLWFDSSTIDLLKKWEEDILMICRAADKTTTPRPGANCIGCPYVNACPDGFEYEGGVEDNAIALASLEENRKALIKELKIELQDVSRMEIPGGYVGYKEQSKTEQTDDAIYRIIAGWYFSSGAKEVVEEVKTTHAMEVGLLKALGIGSGQINSLAKALFDSDNMELRADFLANCLKDVGSVRFGVWKEKVK